MSTAAVPVVDLGASRDPATRPAFVRALGTGLEQWGFVVVTGHGVDAALVEGAYDAARRVFALPDADKRACETPSDGRQRGYTGFGVERAKDQAVPDLKEFWHVGRTLEAGRPVPGLPDNVFPPQVPDFGAAAAALFAALEGFALTLLDAVGEHLGLGAHVFRDLVRDGNSVLRVIHYPDVGEVPVGAVRAAAHEDINLMTVLPAATRPGLELLTRDGRWMEIAPPPGAMICDTGDMMQLFTAGRMPATTHRVVNPGGSDGGRLSMPFFLHPRPDAVLAPLDPAYGPAVRAHDFLAERLRENGVLA